MKVYLIKDVEKVGLAGEILNVSDGFAMNFLIPKKYAVQVTAENERTFEQKKKIVEHRKEVVATATSMLAEKIKSLELIVKRKMHDGNKLYGSISQSDVADLLAAQSVKVAKNQVIFDKSIKNKGSYDVTIKLSSRLQPKVKVTVVPEAA